MATLPNSDRNKIMVGLMRHWSSLWELISGLTSTDLKATVDATDQWIETNQLSFNNSLPEPAKINLTQAQKTLIFCVVAAFRVNKEFAIKLIGGID
jgi:hypothetical protein